MKKKFHRFAIQRILRFKFADCQCCGLHALTLSFVYCLAKPGLSLLPKGDSWVVASWGSTQSSYIAVKPQGFWLVVLKITDPFLPRPW